MFKIHIFSEYGPFSIQGFTCYRRRRLRTFQVYGHFVAMWQTAVYETGQLRLQPVWILDFTQV